MTQKNDLTLVGMGDSWGKRRCLLTFRFVGGVFIGEPQHPFRARGLIIWGAPDGSMVDQCLAGTDLQIVCSAEPAPAAFFSMALTYEQIAEKWQEGIEPPAWCTFKAIEPGQQMRIRLTCENRVLTPADRVSLCMWGIAITL